MERDGGMSPAAIDQVRRLFLISRIDLVVLSSVVAVMVLKPTADDVGTLLLIVAAIAGATGYSVLALPHPQPGRTGSGLATPPARRGGRRR